MSSRRIARPLAPAWGRFLPLRMMTTLAHSRRTPWCRVGSPRAPPRERSLTPNDAELVMKLRSFAERFDQFGRNSALCERQPTAMKNALLTPRHPPTTWLRGRATPTCRFWLDLWGRRGWG